MGFQNKFGHREKIGFAALKTGQAAFIGSVSAFGGINTNVSAATDTRTSKINIISVISYKLGSNPTVSDNNGNVYTQVATFNGVTTTRVTMFYCINPVTSINTIFTVNSGSGYPAFVASFYKGGTFSFNSFNGRNTGSTTSTFTNPVNIISPNNLTVTSVNYWIATIPTSCSSAFNITGIIPPTSSTLSGAFAYKINSILPAENPTWTWTNLSGETSTNIVTFSYT